MRKQIKWVFWFLILIIVGTSFAAYFFFYKKNNPINSFIPMQAKYFYMGKSETIYSIQEPASENLPKTLVITPGKYRFLDHTFDLTREGLYTFTDGSVKHNRIVYKKDRFAMISAWAWLDTPSAETPSHYANVVIEQALTGNVDLSCGDLANFANAFFKENGITTRVILGLNPKQDSKINRDFGHNMVEVKINNRWVLFDIYNNVTFTENGKRLTFWEFYQTVSNNLPYNLERLSGDTSGRNEAELRQYYFDVFKAPLISDDKRYQFPSDTKEYTEYVQKYAKKYYNMPRADWLKLFYYGYGYK